MNYYKHHIGDYLRKTAHLSLLEHGIYRRLMDVYYVHEAAIPADKAARLIGARSKDELRALDVVLSEFFELRDGAWHHARCDEELNKLDHTANSSRENGKKGGRPKKNKTDSVPEKNPAGFDSEPRHNLTPLLHNSTTPEKDTDPIGSGASPVGDPPRKTDPVPYQRIVDSFNETMTKLPNVRDITGKRRTAIRKAWQESTERQSAEFWAAYWQTCADDSFLNGTGPYGNGHENWRPTFDYLIRSDNVTRIVEQAMHNARAA